MCHSVPCQCRTEIAQNRRDRIEARSACHAARIDRGAQFGRARRECRQIDRQQTSFPDDEAAADHDVHHAGAVLAHHHLRGGFVQRDQRRRVEIEEHDIGGVAWRDSPDPLETERTRAAGGGRGEYLWCGDPARRIGSPRMRCRCGEMQRLIHVEIVIAGRRVGADRQVYSRLQHPHRIGNTVAQPHVARRIVRDRGTVRAEPPHVIDIQPHAVRRDEAWPQQAELFDMRGQRTRHSAVRPPPPVSSIPPDGCGCRHRTPPPGRGRQP